VELQRKGHTISLIGIDDPAFQTESVSHVLQKLTAEDSYTILLSHRPELFDTYVKNGIDLAFTGHAHGGQFRLPFVGGVIAPHQGFFPKYDSGLYTKNTTNMLVSRGVGNSMIPMRFNNRPEIIVVELRSE
jgi:predicted MPP superfamily phosphohydrolase